MPFEIIPVLDQMKSLYTIPKGEKRFQQYLQMLQGEEKADMILPIGGFNPMGNELVKEKLDELLKFEPEKKAQFAIEQVANLYTAFELKIGFAINLTDDVGGSWSHYSSADYENKFNMESLFKRGFSVAHFWTGETYDDNLIDRRISEQLLRTIYWNDHGKPNTLADHVQQEHFIQMHFKSPAPEGSPENAVTFLKKHASSTDYNVIFNFLYGDDASEVLGYQTYGMSEISGFDFIKFHLSS